MLRLGFVIIPPASGQFIVFQFHRANPLGRDAQAPAEAAHGVNQAAADDEDLFAQVLQRRNDILHVLDHGFPVALLDRFQLRPASV